LHQDYILYHLPAAHGENEVHITVEIQFLAEDEQRLVCAVSFSVIFLLIQ
jgi:hypothetical protein